MIPKIIHYCWFGRKEIPLRERKIIDDCKEKLSDYKFILWNEDNFDYEENIFSKQAYTEKKFAFVSDVCRMVALYKYGGIYLDTDVEIVKPFDYLLNTNKLIFGMENNSFISTACILSPPNHLFISKILELYNNSTFILEDGKFDIRPNTLRISEMLKNENIILNRIEKQQNDDIVIYPQNYFSPKNYGDETYTITEDTYCVHLFHGSWVPFSMRLKSYIAKLLPSKITNFFIKK